MGRRWGSTSERRERPIGKCWACRHPVWPWEAVRVPDPVVNGLNGKPVRRLAHRGDCAARVREVLGRDTTTKEGR